jgi:hypothetical protein
MRTAWIVAVGVVVIGFAVAVLATRERIEVSVSRDRI